ncbi:MAG: hypothetical protein PWR25_961 [Euryarchaeota archaeon]|jgi:hypothetical protein|nr:hypothetical protein [Euryarchaeota archaeon]MDN5339455.1 hypothetical protein [Euryarchaeota archaeon]
MIATVLLLAAVLAAAIPPLDAPESVIETLDSVRESVGELAQLGADLLSLAREILEWLETGVGYLERLMSLTESGLGLVNETVERLGPLP